MVRIAIVACILAVSLTRLISYSFGIPAIAYFSLIPFVIIAAMTARPLPLHPVDKVVAGLMLIGIAWVPIGILSSMSLINPPPLSQQIKSMIWYEGIFFAYFAIRYVPLPKNAPRFFMLALIIVGCVGAVSIYLQKFGIIGSFYAVDDQTTSLYGYLDEYGIAKYRINGMYGNPHDAGAAMALLIFALFAWVNVHQSKAPQILCSILLGLAFGALILTSSRSNLVVVIIALFFSSFLSSKASKQYQIDRKNYRKLYIFIIAMIILISYPYIYRVFDDTLIFSHGFDFLLYEGRISSNIYSFLYLTNGSLIQTVLGWGLGTGGMAAITGAKVLPVNTVDLFIVSLLANYGIVGVVMFLTFFVRLTSLLISRDKEKQTREHYDDKVLLQFCVMSVVGALISIAINTDIEQKIYPIFTFIAIGLHINHLVRGQVLSRHQNHYPMSGT
ncbi:hypothetical protein [Kordiimonas marina]|uniref:hypothetical protein n=1 Tax=Kordiimonas marina TaxID=2872312 RepID=UPI001FF218BC|nr:hypothetical protein [Kordiimonas marina]MCJ9429978.1 hypothetical protein [Kordiimonas marina]